MENRPLVLKPHIDIESDQLEEYLDMKLNFKLSDDIWIGINDGYAEFYNSLPAYAVFNEDEAFEYTQNYLKQEKLIFPTDKLRIIHRLIFDYLEDTESIFLDDNTINNNVTMNDKMNFAIGNEVRMQLELKVDNILSKDDFLSDENVQNFIVWMRQKLDGEFKHCYIKQDTKKDWECCSIYDAYTQYDWAFHIGEKEISGGVIEETKGHDFVQNSQCLNRLSELLKESIEKGDNELCQEVCLSILEWGGVLYRNERKIKELGNSLIQYLEEAKELLNFDGIRENYQTSSGQIIYMNAGFSKIYSLYIDNFIIYDSRVGAALGLLVKRWDEERGALGIPRILAFAYGNSRGNINRNPNCKGDKSQFLLLRSGNRYNNHIENNLKANWLLGKVLKCGKSKFNSEENPLRALEAALFMIGYSMPNNEVR